MNNIRIYNNIKIEKSNGGNGSYTPKWFILSEDGERLKRFATLKAAKQYIDKQ